MGIPEHPEIAQALRTGYPRPCRSVKCADCEQEFYGSDQMYNYEGELVCGCCMKDRLLDDQGIADLAEAFDIAGTTAEAYLAEQEDL